MLASFCNFHIIIILQERTKPLAYAFLAEWSNFLQDVRLMSKAAAQQ